MEENGVEDILELLIQKASTEEHKDEAMVGLSILFKGEFYGRSPEAAILKKIVGIFITLIMKERRK